MIFIVPQALSLFDGKHCSRCAEWRHFSDFSPRDGSRYKSHCKPCCRLAKRDYKDRNSEKIKASDAAYREANREVLRLRSHQWRKDNPHGDYLIHRRWKKANPEKVKKYSAAFYARNTERFAARWQRYYTANSHRLILKARKNARAFDPNHDTLTGLEWVDIIREQGGVCARCCKPFSRTLPPTRDHIVPLSRGGYLTQENTQALCHKCNCSKFTKTINYRAKMRDV